MIAIKGKKLVSLFVILFINFLFAYKYLSRISEWALLISFAYFLSLLFVVFILSKKEFKFLQSNWLFIIIIVIYTIFCFILFSHIALEQLNVDRWSVISSFWKSVSQDKYPYLATSHMGNHPGPLPVYFILTWPFLKIGELGLFTLVGFVMFSIFLNYKTNQQYSNIGLFILISSVALIWEIVTRSTIFTNSVLYLFVLNWFLQIDLHNSKNLFLSAIIAGLLLSTRTIFAIPLVIIGIYFLKNKILKFSTLLGWSTIIIVTFIITFFPLIINYSSEFWQTNPFTVQSEQLLPFYWAPLIVVISVLFGFLSKQKSDVIFYTSISFLFTFIIYFIHIVSLTSLTDTFFHSKADISYLLFSFPFFVYQLLTTKETIS